MNVTLSRQRSKKSSMNNINKSTAEFNGTTDRVVEDQDTKHGDGRNDEDEYERGGPKSYHPDEHLANHELPKWRRYPEPVPFDPQDEAGCQDTITGSSSLMDRYRQCHRTSDGHCKWSWKSG